MPRLKEWFFRLCAPRTFMCNSTILAKSVELLELCAGKLWLGASPHANSLTTPAAAPVFRGE
jgi:hypothetical protein